MIFNNYSKGCCEVWWTWLASARYGIWVGYNHLISRPGSANGVIVLLKTPTKFREFFRALFVKTTDFQLVFNFEQTLTLLPYLESMVLNGSYAMMAKPIRALELHYPMIQFLIITIIYTYYYCQQLDRKTSSFHRLLCFFISYVNVAIRHM